MRSLFATLLCGAVALSFFSCDGEKFVPGRTSKLRHVRLNSDLLARTALTVGTAPDASFYSNDSTKQYLGTLYPKQVLVAFKSGLSYTAQHELLVNTGFVKTIGKPYASGSDVLFTVELIEGLHSAQVEQVVSVLQELPEITYVGQFYTK